MNRLFQFVICSSKVKSWCYRRHVKESKRKWMKEKEKLVNSWMKREEGTRKKKKRHIDSKKKKSEWKTNK